MEAVLEGSKFDPLNGFVVRRDLFNTNILSKIRFFLYIFHPLIFFQLIFLNVRQTHKDKKIFFLFS